MACGLLPKSSFLSSWRSENSCGHIKRKKRRLPTTLTSIKKKKKTGIFSNNFLFLSLSLYIFSFKKWESERESCVYKRRFHGKESSAQRSDPWAGLIASCGSFSLMVCNRRTLLWLQHTRLRFFSSWRNISYLVASVIYILLTFPFSFIISYLYQQ